MMCCAFTGNGGAANEKSYSERRVRKRKGSDQKDRSLACHLDAICFSSRLPSGNNAADIFPLLAAHIPISA